MWLLPATRPRRFLTHSASNVAVYAVYLWPETIWLEIQIQARTLAAGARSITFE
jgi:hypothetical protein